MITEKDNVFYCDCGFSFERGRSGAHDCTDGLRNKLAESEAKLAAPSRPRQHWILHQKMPSRAAARFR
ncbi:hypothetical protein ACXWYY_000129 [Enterobacter hormaechei]